MNGQRCCGVLLHPTCLPSPFGVGDFGPGARSYLKWLVDAGAAWWQVLPLNPAGPGQSPYSSNCSFAGNTLLISPELLVEDGLLDESDLADPPEFPDYLVDFERVAPWKEELLRHACERFDQAPPAGMETELEEFRKQHGHWLADYVLFTAIGNQQGSVSWRDWPQGLARREPKALRSFRRQHERELRFVELCQFLFFRQWDALRSEAARLGVSFLGDVPIFVDYRSAEVWAHPELFLLDEEGNPTVVAGVPPDYFSPNGQLWGNPEYNWERMADDGYSWWCSRLRHALTLMDATRLDHFRGFVGSWHVDAAETDAVKGRWVPGPGRALFDAVAEQLGRLPFVAEDLGDITEDVHELRRGLGLPGMAILQFAFSTDKRSTFIPYAHTRDLVVYTGTHDNNTTLGWYLEEANQEQKQLLLRYAGSGGHEVYWDMIRLALGSVAETAVIPHQDLLGLGSDCRMNTPGSGLGNWRFRVTPWMLEAGVAERLAGLAWVYGRSRPQPPAAEGAEPAGEQASEDAAQ